MMEEMSRNAGSRECHVSMVLPAPGYRGRYEADVALTVASRILRRGFRRRRIAARVKARSKVLRRVCRFTRSERARDET